MKKKITILFSSAHLSYSPTVLGLYDLLSARFDVEILAENPDAFSNQYLTGRKIVYRRNLHNRIRAAAMNVFYAARQFFDGKIARLKNLRLPVRDIDDFSQIEKYFRAKNPDYVIAVDFKSLFYAQMLNRNAEFLSLEIAENDFYYEHCDFSNINSVIIQTAERYEYLFGDRKFKTFFIQNAPNYREFTDNLPRQNLVYCGTAWNPFGFYDCLNFLRSDFQYKLNVKGFLSDDDRQIVEKDYADLLTDGRVMIDDQYLDELEIVEYLRQFKIGFCFYNFAVEWVDKFNYHSAPSGKMFKYMAAGVPVVGQNISGLSPVREFDCGVLIEDLSPASIKKAVETIENDFAYYSRNCLQAAAHYSFDKNAEPFVNYLLAKQ